MCRRRAPGVTSARESRFLLGVKLLAELGHPAFEALAHWVLPGPAGVSAPIATAMEDTAARARLEERGSEVVAGSPADAEKS